MDHRKIEISSRPLEGEINSDHPVTQGAREQWYKIAAILLWRLGGAMELGVDDIAQVAGKAIVVKFENDVIDLKLVTMEEGERLAREEHERRANGKDQKD